MPDTLAAITAAGIVYDRSDFADPHLPGPTALTVTADGRVYGHLAAWGTPHIGMGGRVTPPKNRSGYKYFHQGIVPTKDGDLPVGKLTLGTGHAPVDGRTDSVAAAAHYDNTGTVAAAVRAGEDQHGIWLAGRIVPGTPPERVDELRLSGVSGDWRGIDGQMELVAALAVNVPGFPVPRTEQLVAAGVPTALVAAGVVAPVQGPTVDEMEAMVASAVATAVRKEVDAARAADRRRAETVAKVRPIIASAAADRRAQIVAEVERVQAARAADNLVALTAAVDSGIPGHLPRDLRKYWTRGAGAARWATSPHPYTALTRALRSELPAKAQHMVNGLAANLFKDRFGIYPGQRETLTAAGEGDGASGDHSGDGMVALLPTAQDAERLAVPDGEPVDEMHLTLGYFPDVAMMPDDDAILSTLTDVLPGPVDGTIGGHATFNPDTEGKTPCAVYLVQADGLAAANQAIAPAGDYDAYTPHITAQYNPSGPLTAAGPVSFDRVRIARAGTYTDVPLGAPVTAAGGRRVRTQEGADRYGVSVGDLIPKAIAEAQGLAGDFAEAASNDVAKFLDPNRKTDQDAEGDALPAQEDDGVAETVTDDDPLVETLAEPELEPDPVDDVDAEAVEPVDEPLPVAAPKSGPGALIPETTSDSGAEPETAEVTTRLEEDQAPTTSPDGADLLDFADGVATYSDGAWTDDGTTWHTADELRDGEDAAPDYVGTRADAPQGDQDAIVEDAAVNEAGTIDTSGFTAEDGLDPNVDDFGEQVDVPEPGMEVTDTTVPVRTDGTGYLEEDQLPDTGANGGTLVDYSDGIAFYDDGTDTDGSTWRYSEPVEEPDDPDAIAASANRHARIMRKLGYRAANRRAVYPKA